MIVDDGFIKKNSILPSGLAWAKTDMNSIEKTVFTIYFATFSLIANLYFCTSIFSFKVTGKIFLLNKAMPLTFFGESTLVTLVERLNLVRRTGRRGYDHPY